MKKFSTVFALALFVLLATGYGNATTKRTNQGSTYLADYVGIADQTDGYTAKVDSDGNLQVEITGLTATLTATSVTVSNIVPGVTGTALGKAEDAAHTTADTGVAVLAVRADTAAVTGGTDGDYSCLTVNATGCLWTEQKGTVTEDAAATAGGFGIYPMAVRTDALAATAGTDGDNINLLSGAEGALYTMGNKAEDAGATGGDYGNPIIGVRTDTLASSSGTTADYSWFNLSALGALYVTGDRAEDAATASGAYGLSVLGVRSDTLAATAGTTGDWAGFQVGAEGAVYVMGDQVEDTASTTADYLMPVAVVRDDWPCAAKCGTTLDYGVLSIDDAGSLYVRDLSCIAEDSAHTSAEPGVFVQAVRSDTLGGANMIAGTDGDYSPFNVNAVGALYTVGNVAEDAAMTSAEMLNPIAAVRSDTLGTAGQIAGTAGDYAMITVGATGALYVMGNVKEDAAMTSGEYIVPIAAIVSTTLGTGGEVAGTTGDYAMVTVDARGALYVKGDRVEDAVHTTGDYLLPIASQRLNKCAASSGSDTDYSTINTDSTGKLYVNPHAASTLTACVQGDGVGGTAIMASAGGALKNRIYRITVTSLAAETITLDELSGFTKIYTSASQPQVLDFGVNGLLQTTAATAITATSADASAVQWIVEYSTE